MQEDPPSQLEATAQAAAAQGQLDEAATLLIDAYGPELYSFALAQFRNQAGIADEVFSEFCEDLWKGLPNFAWQCPARAWCYRLLRSVAARYRRNPFNRPQRRIPLSEARGLENAVHQLRTRTRPYLRTEVKDAFQELREQLSIDDQELLTLRVDRRMSWREVACATCEAEQLDDEQALLRLEVSLRQRFTELKKKLKRLAIAAGLLPQDSDEG